MNYDAACVGFRYFDRLNYTLANEDPSLETEVLPPDQERIAAVGGSGARILPLLSRGPGEMHVIDLSRSQLALCKLRVETLRAMDHVEFLRFWYPWVTQEDSESCRSWRRSWFFRLPLDEISSAVLTPKFESLRWGAITLSGKWEKTFRGFSKLAKLVLGDRALQALFGFEDLEKQRAFVRGEFPIHRFRWLVRIAGSAKTFNVLLYRGAFPRNNSGIPYVTYYERAFLRLFESGLARENFFLHLSLLGRLQKPEGLPLEACPEAFFKSKSGLLRSKVLYHHGDLITTIQGLRNLDFVSLSNVPAYFTGELEREFLSRIRSSVRPYGKLVIRHYLHYPEGLDRTGFQNVNHRFSEALAREKVQMYDPEILEALP